MSPIRRVSPSVVFGLTVLGLLSMTRLIAEDDREAQIAQLREMSDRQLSDRIAHVLAKDDFRREFEYEACLTEIVRRGKGAALLQKQFDALMAREFKRYEDSDER
jgi:hypothetical protein